jgi:hypothetical protein
MQSKQEIDVQLASYLTFGEIEAKSSLLALLPLLAIRRKQSK